MKKLILFLPFLILCSVAIFAQATALPPIYEDAAALVDRYQFTEKQTGKLQKILATRQDNLDAIAALRNTDQVSFWKKRKAIYLGQQAAIERLLDTKEQKQAFSDLKKAKRVAESKIMQELLAKGHSREDIRILVLERLY